MHSLINEQLLWLNVCLKVTHHGGPQSLHTDQGHQFDSDLVKEVCICPRIHTLLFTLLHITLRLHVLNKSTTMIIG